MTYGSSPYGSSPYGSSRSAPPASPVNLRAVEARDTEIDLRWDEQDVPGTAPENGYRIYVSTDGGTTWTEIADISANSTNYTATGLSTGEQYTIRVVAYNESGGSEDETEIVLAGTGESEQQTSPTVTTSKTVIEGEFITQS